MIATIVSSYAVELGTDLTMAGAISGIFSISALLIRPFSGFAMDTMNKRSICIFSASMICLSFLGYAFAPGIALLVVFRVMHGMAFGVNSTANMALIREFIPKERMAEGLGYFGMGQIIAYACGPHIGIIIRDHYGYRPLFLAALLMTLLAVLMLFRVRVTAQEARETVTKKPVFSFRNLLVKECIVYALTAGLFSMVNGITSSFIVLLGDERKIPNIALFFTVNSVALFVLRLTVGRIIDRTGLMLMVNLSLASTAISMFIVASSSKIFLILAAAVLKAIGQGCGQIALQSACVKKVDNSKVGVASSTYYIGLDIGQGLGPIIAGRISAASGYKTMFADIGFLMIIGAVLFSIYQIRTRKMEINAAEI